MNISQASKAILYEKLTDYANFSNRTLQQEITDISSLNTDLIFRAFWQWGINVNSCNDITDSNYKDLCIKSGNSYESLTNSISSLRQTLPNCIIIGAVPAQVIGRQFTYNPKQNLYIQYPDTWNMALDPAKWGITNVTKTQFQCEFAKSLDWYPKSNNCSSYDNSTVQYYFPDLTNLQYQEVLLSWIYSQIDSGVNGIWIDMFTKQAALLYSIVNDLNHPSITDTFNSMNHIINSIHNYGISKGRDVYVGTWGSIVLINRTFNIDFVTVTPSIQEVSTMTYDTSKWNTIFTSIINRYPSIKTIGFIDFSSTKDSPLGIFTQVFTNQQRMNFLTITKNFFESHNVTFAYPVHGGWMGNDATKLSFGTRKEYDSKAPEFVLYNYIKQLMTGTTTPPSSSIDNKTKIIIALGLLGLLYVTRLGR